MSKRQVWMVFNKWLYFWCILIYLLHLAIRSKRGNTKYYYILLQLNINHNNHYTIIHNKNYSMTKKKQNLSGDCNKGLCVPTNADKLVQTYTVVHTTHTALTWILYRWLKCTYLQKWWSLAGCHWWRPVWWFGFWCQPSRSSPPGHRSPPLWHHRCLALLAPSLRSNKGCQCPRHGFQTAAHTGGTFSTLVRWLGNQSFEKVKLSCQIQVRVW